MNKELRHTHYWLSRQCMYTEYGRKIPFRPAEQMIVHYLMNEIIMKKTEYTVFLYVVAHIYYIHIVYNWASARAIGTYRICAKTSFNA